MFIKHTKSSNKEYLQITKSIRIGKKVKHQVVLNLGRREKINKKDIENLITVLQELAEELSENKINNN